jgi:hypothetical protein
MELASIEWLVDFTPYFKASRKTETYSVIPYFMIGNFLVAAVIVHFLV